MIDPNEIGTCRTIPVQVDDEYGNREKKMMSLTELPLTGSTGPVHEPFTDPRAKEITIALYETFKDVADQKSPEDWEDILRENYTVSRETAIWLKIREVFTKKVRGHWNDLEYKSVVYGALLRLSVDPVGLLKEAAEEGRPFVEELLSLWASGETVEEIRNWLRPFLPGDIPIPRAFPDLPPNPDMERFLKSVEAKLDIPVMPQEELRRRARQSYAKKHPQASRNLDKRLLDKECVNWLRHEKTNYEREFNRFIGKLDTATQKKCHAALKGFILDKIADKYPWLEQECLRQRAELS